MFCLHCGKEIGDNAPVCPYCGGRNSAANTKRELFGLLGFGLSLATIIPFASAFSLPALGLSITGIVRAKKQGSSMRLAIAGTVISAIVLIGNILMYAGVF